MRILFDCRSVFPGMGGIGRATAALARELPVALAEHELLLLVGPHHPDEPLAAGPNVQEVPVEAAMIDPVFEQIALPALLEDSQVDLYHNPVFSVPIAARATRTIATVHDVVFRRRPDLVDPWLRDYLDRWTAVACDLAAAVVTVSDFSRREIKALYGRGEVDVIPNGIAPSFFSIARLTARDPFILYVGALEAKKNVVPLLRAFARFRHFAPELPHKLVLVGGVGGGSLDLRAVFEKEPALAERVHVLGYVPDEELQKLYGAADAFCYLSEYEGFGLPPLEAMAAGVPTIVSDRSSLPEVTAGAATIADPGDPDDVGGKLAHLLRHGKNRAEIVRRGREVARRYRWDDAARSLARVYERVGKPTPFKVLAGGAA